MGIKTADKLLQEVKPQTAKGQYKADILECYIMMTTKSKPNIEKSLEKLMGVAAERVSCTATLGTVIGWG